MKYDEMDAAIQEAEAVIKRAELFRNKMARFLIGRLGGVDVGILRRLKKELRNFNSNTNTWK